MALARGPVQDLIQALINPLRASAAPAWGDAGAPPWVGLAAQGLSRWMDWGPLGCSQWAFNGPIP